MTAKYTLDTYDDNGVFERTLEATEEQADIIDFALANDAVNLIINALAGAAKTSTLQFLCKYLPVEPVCSLAFNKRIADRMAKVLPGHVRSSTVNSICHRVWGSTVGKRLIVDTKKNYNIVKEMVEHLPRSQRDDAWDI